MRFTLASGEMTTSGGGLSSEYKMVHIDSHWGSNDTVGSEHTVAGRHYPLEVTNTSRLLELRLEESVRSGRGRRERLQFLPSAYIGTAVICHTSCTVFPSFGAFSGN